MTTEKKIFIGAIITAGVIAVLRLMAAAGAVGIILFGAATAKPKVYDEVEKYTEYMSFSQEKQDTIWNKWGMDESIWPASISTT